MIIIGGKPYRTLADPIYTNGKRVQKVFVNGKQAYPEVYEKPAIGASGNVLKIRGKHTSEFNFYCLEQGDDYGFNTVFRGTVSFAAYMNMGFQPFRSFDVAGKTRYEAVSLSPENIKSEYERFVYSDRTIPSYYFKERDGSYWNAIYGNGNVHVVPYMGEDRIIEELQADVYFWQKWGPENEYIYLDLPYFDSYFCESHSFCKIVFKINIDPFYIPMGSKGITEDADRYYIQDTFNNIASAFNNKIYTIYSGSESTTSDVYETTFGPNLTYASSRINIDGCTFYEDRNGTIRCSKRYGHPYAYSSSQLEYEDMAIAHDNPNPNGDINSFSVYFSNNFQTSSNIINPYSLRIDIKQWLKHRGIIEPIPSDTTNNVQQYPTGSPVNIRLGPISLNAIGDDVIYLGSSIDPVTNTVVPTVQKEDLLDYDGTEEIIEPVIDTNMQFGYSEDEVHKQMYRTTELKSYDMSAIYDGDISHLVVDIDCPNVSIIGRGGLNTCFRLLSAIFPKVREIGELALAYCYNLIHADFPLLTTIESQAFMRNIELKIANFPACTTIKASAFCDCYRLESPHLPNVSIIEQNAFYNCYLLKEAVFPMLKYVSRYTFCNCADISTVYTPIASYIGSNAFRSCSSLTTITATMAESIGSLAFDGCTSLNYVNFPNCSAVNASAFRSCYSLTRADFIHCETIMESMFADCSSLETVNFPECNWIEASAFLNCTSLKNVNFQKASRIQNCVFEGCTALLSTNFQMADTIGYRAFERCSSLKELSFPNVEDVFTGAFSNCTSLETITFNKLSRIGSYSYIFYGCKNLKSLFLLYSNRGYGCNLHSNYSNAFENSSLLDGTCKIYVPSETYSFYMIYWSQFASQIVSITS